MSVLPSEDYITATKLIESFSCFYEKLATISSDQILNMEKLTQLKKVLYNNISSPETLVSASDNLYAKYPSPSKYSSSHSRTKSEKIEPTRSFISHAPISSMTNILQPDFDRAESRQQVPFQEDHDDGLTEREKLSTEYLPATSFLALVRAASHNEMSRLFALSSSYAYIRTFSDHQQPLFTVLCFAFFEKMLKEKGRDSQTDLAFARYQRPGTESEPLAAQEAEFVSNFKNLCPITCEFDLVKKCYEFILTNQRLYYSIVSIFKQHLMRILVEKHQPLSSKWDSFEWMNDFDGTTEAPFLQGLAQVFKTNMKFMFLTSDQLIEKVYYFERKSSTRETATGELTIFFDKTSKSAFILYPFGKLIEDEPESPMYQRVRAKVAPVYAKPPLKNESLRSVKSLGADGSLSTLDSAGTPVTSLNDVENRERQYQRNNARPQQHLRKISTLNVVTGNSNECSTSYTYPESAVLRPSTEKIRPISPHSASKEIGYYRSKTIENDETPLSRKDREPVPVRFNNYGYRESPIGEQRTSRMLNDEKSPVQDYYSHRGFMSDSKAKPEFFHSKTCSIDFSKGDYGMRSGYIKTTPVSIALTSKFDRFNQALNYDDTELNSLVAKYARKGNISNRNQAKGAAMPLIMKAYQNMTGQLRITSRPSVGVSLKMDGMY